MLDKINIWMSDVLLVEFMVERRANSLSEIELIKQCQQEQTEKVL